MKFRAKGEIGWAVIGFVLLVWIFLLLVASQARVAFTMVSILLAGLEVLMLHMTLCSYVRLESDALLIVLGLVRMRVPWRDISLIRETHNPLSSMALSLDRLGIENKACGYVMIAVKDKEGFLREVKLLHPHIHIVRREGGRPQP